MAAALAEGVTTLENCALEPEIADLAQLLAAMGAKISGAGTSTISIEGVGQLHGASHRVPPDRIETGTFLAAAAATRGDIRVLDTNPDFLHHVLGKLEQAGASWSWVPTGFSSIPAANAARRSIYTRPLPRLPH